MKLLNASHLKELADLTSESLVIDVAPTRITFRLMKVVALSNFKVIAAAGRGAGASFNSSTKTLTLMLASASDARPASRKIGFSGQEEVHGFMLGGRFYEAAPEVLDDVVAIYANDNWDTLVKLATRLAGGKAKTFKSTRDAGAARRSSLLSEAQAQREYDNDIGRSVGEIW